MEVIQEGEEVFVDYGSFSAEKYLEFYGMIPDCEFPIDHAYAKENAGEVTICSTDGEEDE